MEKLHSNQTILDEIETEWNWINVDLDAPEDCVRMCKFIQSLLTERRERLG